MSDTCPKCGAALKVSDIKVKAFKCKSFYHHPTGEFYEDIQCVRNQLAVADQRSEAAEQDIEIRNRLLNASIKRMGMTEHKYAAIVAAVRELFAAEAAVVNRERGSAKRLARARTALLGDVEASQKADA